MYMIHVQTIEFRTELGEVENGKAKITMTPKSIEESILNGTFRKWLESSLKNTEKTIQSFPDKDWVIQSHN
ncbi:MAG: hypothetical protein ACLPVI_08750, partial [Dehalococcoidales bacterium]